VTDRLRLRWPDASAFAGRDGRPIRILAISDEPDPSLDSAATRQGLGRVDLVIGAGDLQPEYLSFIGDAFGAPLRYVRGNHDVGSAWADTERSLLPEPMPDATVIEEDGLRMIGFSGSPKYSGRGLEIGGMAMWRKALRAWLRGANSRPLLVVSHAPPRDLNDDTDLAHRGFPAFRWLTSRLAPPLWLHGHTALIRRGIGGRCVTHEGTLFYNCTGATLIELVPPDAADG
jgi:uncharacterized protein